MVVWHLNQMFSHWVLSNSVTPWTEACQASLSFTILQNLLKLMSIVLVMPSNHLILCRLLLLLSSVFPSSRGSSNVLALCIRWQNYWSFSFIISPSNEYSGLISFRIDWFDLFAVQGTLKSLIQHHNSCTPDHIVQASHLMQTWKNLINEVIHIPALPDKTAEMGRC